MDWLKELASMKDLLARESHLQIVGSKVYWEVEARSGQDQIRLMLEVIGIPTNPDQNVLEICDMESGEMLVYGLSSDLFHTGLGELLKKSRELYQSLEKMIQGPLAPKFHIAYDHEKIELHFFSQKDYIQNRC